MFTKLELLQKIAESGIKLNKGKMTKKDLLVILKKAKGNKADEFRRITKTDSAELKKKSKNPKIKNNARDTKEKLVHCYIEIFLGHGLQSDYTMDAFDIRNSIEEELEGKGYEVCGAGIGGGSMDISLWGIKKAETNRAKEAITKIIKKSGLKKFTIEFKDFEDEDYKLNKRT